MEYVSEEEAQKLCGVSKSTLTRFQEAGYLTHSPAAGGSVQFLRSELVKLFQIPNSSIPDNRRTTTKQSEESSRKVAGEIRPKRSRLEQQIEKTAVSAPVADEVTKEEKVQPVVQEKQIESEPVLTAEKKSAKSDSSEDESPDTIRLKSLVHLLERLLETKESALEKALEEVAWLRLRIEKLEEKGDRDQMLLLTELRTVAALIEPAEEKRSLFSGALRRLGFGRQKEG